MALERRNGDEICRGGLTRSACVPYVATLSPTPLAQRLASALARVLTEFSIEQQNVAAVTTEAEATGREVIDKLTSTPWLPCICYMMDHVMGVMMTDIAQASHAVQ